MENRSTMPTGLRDTTAADESTDESTAEPPGVGRHPWGDAWAEAVPPPPPARQRVWSMPKVEETRKRTAEWGRIAARATADWTATAATALANVVRALARLGVGIAAFGAQVVKEVPPALRLLGALGLGTILSIIGSVALDNTLGRSCAVVFAPGFALAFGVVAHRWYRTHDKERLGRNGMQATGRPLAHAERSVAYADAKLAFALSAFGTERHQEAVVALIQAKTATELAGGSGQDDARRAPRPRIRDGGVSKMPHCDDVSPPRQP